MPRIHERCVPAPGSLAAAGWLFVIAVASALPMAARAQRALDELPPGMANAGDLKKALERVDFLQHELRRKELQHEASAAALQSSLAKVQSELSASQSQQDRLKSSEASLMNDVSAQLRQIHELKAANASLLQRAESQSAEVSRLQQVAARYKCEAEWALARANERGSESHTVMPSPTFTIMQSPVQPIGRGGYIIPSQTVHVHQPQPTYTSSSRVYSLLEAHCASPSSGPVGGPIGGPGVPNSLPAGR